MNTLNSDRWVSEQLNSYSLWNLQKYIWESQLQEYTTLCAPKKFKSSSGTILGQYQLIFCREELKWWYRIIPLAWRNKWDYCHRGGQICHRNKCFFIKTVPGHTNNGSASALLLIPLDLAPRKISITDLLMELTEVVRFEYNKQHGQHLELPADSFENIYPHLWCLYIYLKSSLE